MTMTVKTIGKMNTLPFSWRQLAPLVIAALLPFVPVACIEVPAKEVLLRVLKLVK